MRIPGIIVAADDRSWIDYPFNDRDGTSYNASTHTLKYELRGSISAALLTLNAVTLGTGWKTSITAAQSGPLNPSAADLLWYWQAFATAVSGGARVLAGEGRIIVRPNLAGINGATTYDGRTQDEKDLAAIDAELSARASGGTVEEYSIAGRSLRKTSATELLAWRTRILVRVKRARAAESVRNGLGNPSRVGVRFR
jgi:hypothetical protein